MVDGGLAALRVVFDIKPNPLACVYSGEASAIQSRSMDKNVLAAVIRFNESKPGIVKYNDARNHELTLASAGMN
jgi:hypothetical protein